MRKTLLFSIVLAMSTISLLAYTSWMVYAFGSMATSDWMLNMMNRMMGGQFSAPPGSSLMFSPWMAVLPLGLVATTVLGVVGLAYFVLFSELRQPKPSRGSERLGANVYDSVDVLMRTLTTEEKMVLEVLIAHEGKYLQKYVRKEAGLSRLKTHRIIVRFAERGIVNVTKFGNTNQVVLADWLKKGGSKRSPESAHRYSSEPLRVRL